MYLTPEHLEISLRHDLGVSLKFEFCEKIQDDSEGAFELNPEVVRQLFPMGKGISGDVDASVCRLNGQNVLRFNVRPPIFDAEDRAYDSWHTLILYVNEKNGEINAYYYTGGYHLATAVKCIHLLEIPDALFECMKTAGLLSNA